MTQNKSFSKLHNQDQLHKYLKELIEFHCQNHKMKFPISFIFDDPEYKFFMGGRFEIKSELDIEITALVLSYFPYGDPNKYSIGNFCREADLIRLASTRYKKDKDYKSFKDFYEKDPEACFDKITSILPRDDQEENLMPVTIDEKEICFRSNLINSYGYPSPMNFLEQEFNHMIWDAFKSNVSKEDFESYVYDKRLFLRSYFDKILKNQKEIELISLNEFIYSELHCSHY